MRAPRPETITDVCLANQGIDCGTSSRAPTPTPRVLRLQSNLWTPHGGRGRYEHISPSKTKFSSRRRRKDDISLSGTLSPTRGRHFFTEIISFGKRPSPGPSEGYRLSPIRWWQLYLYNTTTIGTDASACSFRPRYGNVERGDRGKTTEGPIAPEDDEKSWEDEKEENPRENPSFEKRKIFKLIFREDEIVISIRPM